MLYMYMMTKPRELECDIDVIYSLTICGPNAIKKTWFVPIK